MAKKTPIVTETKLSWFDADTGQQVQALDIKRDWQHWQQWLAAEKSFRFIGGDGTTCTVIKEQRKHFGADLRPVWYAHKRLGGKLRRKYIGISENVTHQKLSAAAFALSQRELL